MRDDDTLDLARRARRAENFGIGVGVEAGLIGKGGQVARHCVDMPAAVEFQIFHQLRGVGQTEARFA